MPEPDARPDDLPDPPHLYRSWVPDGTEPRLTDGFLAQPTYLEGGFVLSSGNGHLREWTAFDGIPVILLLGPPGIGKTTEVEEMASLEIPPCALVNLADVTTSSDLDALLDRPDIEAWERGESRLTLYLDSYDEGRADAKALGRSLLRHLQRGPPDTLFLRIACRDADRPRRLERELEATFGHIDVYSLAPLTRGHAYWIAARSLGEARAHLFLDEVDRVGAQPLAAAPLTLNQLIGDFQEHGELSDDRVSLFESAVGRLAVETSPSRREMDRSGVMTRDENVALAARIAALLQFSGRATLRLDDEPDPSALTLDDVAGEGDGAWTGSVPVRQAVRELVLHSGLFTASGSGHRLVHRSYEEFLAARFLTGEGTPPDGVWALSEHPDGTLRPQHRETLAWLAAMSPEVREALVSRDPVAALTYVAHDLEPEGRRRAVEAFLEARDENRITYGTSLPNRDRLVFDELDAVLERWMGDSARSVSARVAAVDLAGDTGRRGTVEALVQTALMTSDPTLRRRAATVALDLGDPDVADALAPLETVDDEPGESTDPDRSTAFAVRAARFPDLLSFDALIGQMESESGHITLESSRAAERFATESIAEADLPVGVLDDGLRWLAGRPRLDAATAHLANAIVAAAWPHAAALADGLVAALLPVRAGHVQPVAMVEWPSADLPDDDRRALITAAVHADAAAYDPTPPDPSFAPGAGALATPSRRVLRHDDLGWVLERFRGELDPNRKAVWALAADHVARFPDDADTLEAISDPDNPSTAILYHTHFAPDPHHPDLPRWRVRSDRQAEREAEVAARIAERETPVAPDPPVVQSVLDAASRVVEGDAGAWSDVVLQLRRDPDDSRTPHGFDWHDDIRRARAWDALLDTGRAIVAVVARLALGVSSSGLPDADVAAAFRVLSEQSDLDTLNLETWTRHAGVLVRTPIVPNGTETVARRGALLQEGYRQAPGVVLDALRELLVGTDSLGATVAHAAAQFWDGPLADVVAEAAEAARSPLAAHEFLRLLAVHQDPRALQIALDRAETLRTHRDRLDADAADPSETDGLRFVTDAFFVDPEATWRYVVETLTENERRALLIRLAHVGQIRSAADAPVPVLEDLAQRLDAVDVDGEDGDVVRAFRFRVLRDLVAVGAVEALGRLHHPTIEHLLRSAREARASLSPDYRAPSEVLALARDPDSAPIRSDHDLQVAVVRSLARLQKRLTGRRHGASHLLWNTAAPIRPKGEEEVSSYVTRHLEDDLGTRGVSAVREAEALQGSETDILVIRSFEGGGEAQVIVEVKGSWNDEYASGLVEQLARRYLHETGRHHGVHLVASFEKALWDTTDSRYAASRKPDYVLDQIEEKASEAAREGYHVVPVLLSVGPHKSISHR